MPKIRLLAGLYACGFAGLASTSWALVHEIKSEQAALLTTADHRKFQALNQEFQSGPEVTKACLSCHTEAAKQVHKSIHWSWQWEKAGGLGKKNAVNNF